MSHGGARQSWQGTVRRGFDKLTRATILLIPVILSKDGILPDGHQRLRLMLAEGHATISANDVRIDTSATANNALERAIQLGANRRQLTVEQKAAVARKYQRERGWSQARSQPCSA